MPALKHNGLTVELLAGETVLEALLRVGVNAPSSCRSGACQTCLMRVESGLPTAKSQEGLKDTLRAQGYFLPCVCVPDGDLVAAFPDADAVQRVPTRVIDVTPLNADIVRVRLAAPERFVYLAGQFLHLHHPGGAVRSYSLASLPSAVEPLEIHVRLIPGGQVSQWVHSELGAGDHVDIGGPAGSCFYVPGEPERSMLLVGTGSGLAPLFGILRDALNQGHSGRIVLIHGSLVAAGLYLVEEATALSRSHSNFRYVPTVLNEDGPNGSFRGQIIDAVTQEVPNPKGWRVYACGHPEMVKAVKRQMFLAGASLKDLYSDPFIIGSPPAVASD